jgi:chromosome segregation ATPase
MQLENAIREADDMRKYNAAIRKEHSETIADLESELEKERSGKTDLLSQIVTLQYRVATLEQELEEGNDGGSRSGVEVELYCVKSKLDEAESSVKGFKEKEKSVGRQVV